MSWRYRVFTGLVYGWVYLFVGKGNMILMVIFQIVLLTHKWLEMHGGILSTIVKDALLLKHQAISTHSD